MYKVLLVDDALDVHNLVRVSLAQIAQIDAVVNIAEANDKILTMAYDLYLIDLNLPDGSGFSFLSFIRSREDLRKTPVLILSASKTVEDRIAGYSLGADDFLSKPFDRRELLAIVDSKLRRRHQEDDSILCFGDLRINLFIAKVIRSSDPAAEVSLSPLEFKIFHHLLKNKNAIVSRQQILDRFWGLGFESSDRVIDSHISSLRRKLGPEGKRIRTVYGNGYLIEDTHPHK